MTTNAKGQYSFFILITLMSCISVLATDIYLPALPTIALHFNATQTEVQSSFTVFLLGLALSQLIAGWLSDRFGRKKVVVLGISLFTLSSILCVYATTLNQFILFRGLQAIGGGVGSLTSRALVVDRYNREESAKIFSSVFPMVGLTAAIAPLLGGYISYLWGWQTTFWAVAAFGFFIFGMIFITLKHNRELLHKKNNRAKRGYRYILSNLEFWGYLFIIGSGFCVFRSYSVESPFVFNQQGYTVQEVGRFYIWVASAYILGNLCAKKLISQFPIERVLKIGFLFFVGGGILMITLLQALEGYPFAMIIPMMIITFGNGLLFPVSSASAMTSVSTEHYGTASGLLGAIQSMAGAFCSYWVGTLCQGQAQSLSLFVGGLILIGFLSYLWLAFYYVKPDNVNIVRE